MTDVVDAMAAVLWDSDAFNGSYADRDAITKAVRAALAAALERGWKLVPVVPTEAMKSAGVRLCEVDGGPCCDYTGAWPRDVYRAMIQSSPEVK